MKKAYKTPFARKIDFSYEEQIAAKSYPISNYADPWEGGRCTYGGGDCSLVYNTLARGWNDCQVQG